jgi:hypothetical protein
MACYHFQYLAIPLGIFILVVVAGCGHSTGADGPQSEVVLFRKAIAGGRELVVSHGPRHPLDDLAPHIMSKQSYSAIEGASGKGAVVVISVRLHAAPHEPPLTLASRLVPVYPDAISGGGPEVFDLLADDGLIVMAVASHTVELWRIAPFGSPRVTAGAPKKSERRASALPQVSVAFLPSDWMFSRPATFRFPDRKSFSVTLRLADDGRVEAEVADLKASDRRRTRFIQAGDDWEFKAVGK